MTFSLLCSVLLASGLEEGEEGGEEGSEGGEGGGADLSTTVLP